MLSYMANGAPDKVCWFIEIGGGFPGVLLGSQGLMWMMSDTVLGDVIVLHWLYLAAKPFHVGVNVDKLAYPLHCPMTCGRQTRGHNSLSSVVFSHRATVDSGAFLGIVRPWDWIFDGVLIVRVLA
jgi:hypothetical protein